MWVLVRNVPAVVLSVTALDGLAAALAGAVMVPPICQGIGCPSWLYRSFPQTPVTGVCQKTNRRLGSKAIDAANIVQLLRNQPEFKVSIASFTGNKAVMHSIEVCPLTWAKTEQAKLHGQTTKSPEILTSWWGGTSLEMARLRKNSINIVRIHPTAGVVAGLIS